MSQNHNKSEVQIIHKFHNTATINEVQCPNYSPSLKQERIQTTVLGQNKIKPNIKVTIIFFY